MKVLHLPDNIASQISIAVEALRENGIDARGLVTSYSVIQSANYIEIQHLAHKNVLFRYIKTFFSTPKILNRIGWADVIHWHFGRTALPKWIDLRWARMIGIPGVVEFWGSDIRIAEIASQDNPYLARAYQLGEYPKKGEYEASIKKQEMFANAGCECIISCHSLEPYIKPGLFKKVHFIRQRVEVNKVRSSFPSPTNTQPLVVHSPSNPLIKGTAAVLEAIEILKQKVNFDFQLIMGMPHQQAMEVLKKADIYLDQFIGGAHGVAALEAMALGKPVLCYIKPSMVEKYPPEIPIINANMDNLTEVLEVILKDGKLRYEIGMQGRRYVEKYHDASKLVKELINVYEGIYSSFRGIRVSR
jgi:hypothetical protein